MKTSASFRASTKGAPGIYLQHPEAAGAETPNPFAEMLADSEEAESVAALPKTQVNIIDSKAEANPIFTSILFLGQQLPDP